MHDNFNFDHEDPGMESHTLPQADNEGAMAKADLYKLANYSFKLFKKINDEDQLEAWVQAKITKAADYIASVYHYLEYEMEISEYGRKIEDNEMYSESKKQKMQSLLQEAKEKVKELKSVQAKKVAKTAKAEKVEENFEIEAKPKNKSRKLTDDIVQSAPGEYKVKGSFEHKRMYTVDTATLPKYGKVYWVNDHGANMIVTKEPGGAIKVHATGSQASIAAKWNRIKDRANRDEGLAESILSKVVKVIEAAPSAGMSKKEKSAVVKKAKAGKDIGKPGKNFKKVEKAAAKSGATDPAAVAAAAMWKSAKKAVKESEEYIDQVEQPVDDDLDEGMFGLNKSPEDWAETSTQMAQLLQLRQKYQGTEYATQIESRIKALKDRLDLDKGEVLDGSGNPKEVVPPEQFNSAQLNESKEFSDILKLSGL